ncbi:type ISP restriction/modification enzyme [Streptomyces fildesensis]|uniref:type ISP restriction/modification enzyme n=1 Tax=Streptomyces fildesensis TaxID=375757 RepID=UPI0018E02D06|nr:type ISP restriction/modification enzyme [Streptomyces fildesensis]
MEVSADSLASYVAGVVACPAFTQTFADELNTPGVRVPLTADPDLWSKACLQGEDVIWASTFGERFVDDAHARNFGDVLFPQGDGRRIVCEKDIGAEVPGAMTYDEDKKVINLGLGSFGPVTPAMWEYDVGGNNVLRKWFGYRKALPDGKKTSPLDHVHVATWPLDWITEFMEVLSVLRRLTDLHEQQADTLAAILAGAVISVSDLSSELVLPVPESARQVRSAASVSPIQQSIFE